MSQNTEHYFLVGMGFYSFNPILHNSPLWLATPETIHDSQQKSKKKLKIVHKNKKKGNSPQNKTKSEF